MFLVLVILLYFYRNIAFSMGYFVSNARSNRLVLKLLGFFFLNRQQQRCLLSEMRVIALPWGNS